LQIGRDSRAVARLSGTRCGQVGADKMGADKIDVLKPEVHAELSLVKP
jgi:hypothetical protein